MRHARWRCRLWKQIACSKVWGATIPTRPYVIYVYVCMYVCMYVCLFFGGGWGDLRCPCNCVLDILEVTCLQSSEGAFSFSHTSWLASKSSASCSSTCGARSLSGLHPSPGRGSSVARALPKVAAYFSSFGIMRFALFRSHLIECGLMRLESKHICTHVYTGNKLRTIYYMRLIGIAK